MGSKDSCRHREGHRNCEPPDGGRQPATQHQRLHYAGDEQAAALQKVLPRLCCVVHGYGIAMDPNIGHGFQAVADEQCW